MMFQGMVVKNLASSYQGIDHSRTVSDVGCFERVVRNTRSMVKYGFKVDHANGKAFWVGFFNI
jgi:hypothetical protein